jgi:hypothetical protein
LNNAQQTTAIAGALDPPIVSWVNEMAARALRAAERSLLVRPLFSLSAPFHYEFPWSIDLIPY